MVIDKIEQYAEDSESLATQVISPVNSVYLCLKGGNPRVIFSVENGATAILLILLVRHRRNLMTSQETVH